MQKYNSKLPARGGSDVTIQMSLATAAPVDKIKAASDTKRIVRNDSIAGLF